MFKEDILLNIKKPARYIGYEHNAIYKDLEKVNVKVALCFPDTYEVGMSHLGIKILYGILNEIDDIACERAFAPWIDMEEIMRKQKIPLFTLESKTPVKDFDIIGFSLQYELSYTNVLNMLDLADIPLRTEERLKGNFPLVIAGGPCCVNPEPMSEFIDVFVIGEGEEVIVEIVNEFRKIKNKENFLNHLSNIEGVYVPLFPKSVKKRTVLDFENAYYPTKQLVPLVEVIHDRIPLEIMRGCVYRCRFCQATNIYFPRRQRSVGRLTDLAQKTYFNTGYENISLISLSSGDYPKIEELIVKLNSIFKSKGVSISLPSLRIEEMIDKLPLLISQIKKTGLTFAPEAGTERLRNIINKRIDMQRLFEATRSAYKSGYRHIKLYFMIGLPGETEQDLKGIIDLASELAELKRAFDRYPADIKVSIASFIPKPHTPFQWAGMESLDAFKEKQKFLRSICRKRYIRLDFHDVRTSLLEATLSRADKKISEVIYRAHKKGARMDGWRECFNFNIWQDAFKECNINPKVYLAETDSNNTLPWDYVDLGISKEVLLKEYNRAMEEIGIMA